MTSDAGASAEWSLYWTSRGRPVPARLAPVLAGWADLDQREDAADIGPGHPVLIDPECRLDPVLARFLGRSRFAWLAELARRRDTLAFLDTTIEAALALPAANPG